MSSKQESLDAVAADNVRSLQHIIRRIGISEYDALTFDGFEVTQKKFGLPRVPPEAAEQAPIIPDDYPEQPKALAQALYKEVYCHISSDLLRYPQNTDKLRDDAFVQEIRDAHDSRWSWVGNFRFVAEENGQVRVGAKYWGEFWAARANVEGPDAAGRVRLRRDVTNETMQPSFIHLLGEEAIPVDQTVNCRLYWNVGPEGTIPLVRSLSSIMNRHRLPFQYKVLKKPSHMDRPDTALLYFPRYTLARVQDVLPEIHDEVKHYLRWQTPPFAKRLAPGVAYAEDPGSGSSFGESRCQTVALLLWDALQAGHRSREDILNFVVAGLGARGYPLHRLHLNPESDVDIHVRLEAPKLPLEEFAHA